MGAAVEQAHRFVLAVHLDQQGAKVAQHPDTGGLVVDEGAGAAVRRQGPAQHQILVAVIVEALVVQEGEHRMVGRQGEDGGDHGLGRPAAHQGGVGPRAQGQAQRIQDDRLASPRLTGERGQARPERQVQAFDQDDVANAKADQHGPFQTLLMTRAGPDESRRGARPGSLKRRPT